MPKQLLSSVAVKTTLEPLVVPGLSESHCCFAQLSSTLLVPNLFLPGLPVCAPWDTCPMCRDEAIVCGIHPLLPEKSPAGLDSAAGSGGRLLLGPDGTPRLLPHTGVSAGLGVPGGAPGDDELWLVMEP